MLASILRLIELVDIAELLQDPNAELSGGPSGTSGGRPSGREQT